MNNNRRGKGKPDNSFRMKQSPPTPKKDSSPNGTPKESPAAPGAPSSTTSGSPSTPAQSSPSTSTHTSETGSPFSSSLMLDRTLCTSLNTTLLQTLLIFKKGKQVEVEVKSGETYVGLLHTCCTDKGFGVVLKMARKKDANQDQSVLYTRPMNTFVIYPGDFVQLYAKDVTFEARSEREFATDTDISGHATLRERKLQPWIPDSDIPAVSLEAGDTTSWDQFAVNEQKFGVQTTWDENLYTTPLERDGQNYEERRKMAERIAAEIEGKVSSNIHVNEERGIVVGDDNEESRYGAVIRETKPQQPQAQPQPQATSSTTGKYIPPQKRLQSQAAAPSQQPTTGTSEQKEHKPPTSATAPQDEKPIKDTQPPTRSPKATATSPLSRGSSTEELLKSPNKTISPDLLNERVRIRATLVKEKLKNSAPVVSEQIFPPHPNKSPMLSPLISDPRSVNALSLDPGVPRIPEDVLDDFFKFSLNAKKEQMNSQRERMTAELKNFSKSLEKKFPGKEEPAAAASEQTTTTTQSTSTTPSTSTSTSKPTSQPESTTTTTTSSSSSSTTSSSSSASSAPSKSKLNPNAKVFKPMSATAPAFTPSAAPEPYGEFRPQFEEPPYGYYPPMRPMFPHPGMMPYGVPQPMIPQMYGGAPMRMMGSPNQTPPMQYPQFYPQVYSPPSPQTQSPPQQQGGKRNFVPAKNTTSAYPPQQYMGRGGPMAYPQPYGQMDPYYYQGPPESGKEGEHGKKGSPSPPVKFQGVPNTDNINYSKEEKKGSGPKDA